MFSSYEEAITAYGLFVVGVLIGVLSQRVKLTWKK